MSTRSDIAGVVGDDLTFNFALTYNGSVVNLNSYTPKVVVKASANAADGTGTTYTVGSGITLTNAVRGRFTLAIPHSATSSAGTAWYRCYLTDPSGNVSTAMLGNLVLLAA